MQIDVLGSSSLGNAYIVNDGSTSLLLDCGFPLRELQIKSNFKVNDVSACLISHLHLWLDHSKGAKELLTRAVDIYAPPETITALNLSGHRVHPCLPNETLNIGSFTVLPIPMYHDCTCYGYLIKSQSTGKKLFFATDTYKITVNPKGVDYLIVEINYQMDIINSWVKLGII